MDTDELIPGEEEVQEEANFRAGLIAKKNITLTGEKLVELRNGLFTSSYQVIDRNKIVSTSLDYTFTWKPLILGLAVFVAGLNINRISFVEAQFPLASAALNILGGLIFLYGLTKIRKEHIVETSNPDVRMTLPRRGKSTEILNKITEKL